MKGMLYITRLGNVCGVVGQYLPFPICDEIAAWINENTTPYQTIPYTFIGPDTKLIPTRVEPYKITSTVSCILSHEDAVAVALRWGDLVVTRDVSDVID